MKSLIVILTFLYSFNLFATDSAVIPVVTEAMELYVQNQTVDFVVRPDLFKIINILKEKEIDPIYLQNILAKKTNSTLPEKDEYDLMIENQPSQTEVAALAPAISLHAFKLDIKRQSDLFSDDVYAYYFITDGVIPTGKITSIYKDTKSGQSFFFNEVDRAIFPLVGIPAKVPQNHLIVDYGIIESDGDDIKEMQKLSSIIIDLAIAVYTTRNPEGGAVLAQMRREIKALADMLIELNSDDRLITGSFAFKNEEITDLLKDTTYFEFSKRHKEGETFGGFDYTLNFRLLR